MLKKIMIVVATAALALVAPTVARAGVVPPPPPPPTTKVLPISSWGPLAVDGVHDQLFIAGAADHSILVTDYAGETVGTIPSAAPVAGLLVAGDLYVAADDSVIVYDTADLTQLAVYPTGGERPVHLVKIGDTLWFSYQSGLGAIAADGAVRLYPHFGDIYSGAPLLAAAAGVLVESGVGFAARVNVVDVSGAAPVVTAGRSGLNGAGSPAPWVAVSPDGSQVVATGVQGLATVLSTTDLSTVGDFRSTPSPSFVGITADGTVAINEGEGWRPDVALFRPGKADPVTRLPIVTTGHDYAGDSVERMAVEPDGPRVFVIAGSSTGKVALQVLNEPYTMGTAAEIAAPATAQLGEEITVSGRIAATVPPAGLPVSIVRNSTKVPDGVPVGPVILDESGAFSFTDRMEAAGTTNYFLRFAGTDDYLPSLAITEVEVHG